MEGTKKYAILVDSKAAGLLLELFEQAAVKVGSARALADLHEQAQAAVKELAQGNAA